MDYKIVQILPAIKEMYAIYKDQMVEGEAIEVKNRIVCLALIKYGDGETEVVPMDITDSDGEINRLGDGLKCVSFS